MDSIYFAWILLVNLTSSTDRNLKQLVGGYKQFACFSKKKRIKTTSLFISLIKHNQAQCLYVCMCRGIFIIIKHSSWKKNKISALFSLFQINECIRRLQFGFGTSSHSCNVADHRDIAADERRSSILRNW